jgi:hypothetical protein
MKIRLCRFGSTPSPHHDGDKCKPPPPPRPGLKTAPAASAIESPRVVMANPHEKRNQVPPPPPPPVFAALQNPHANMPPLMQPLLQKLSFETATPPLMPRANPCAKSPPTMMHGPCVKKENPAATPTIVVSPADFVPSQRPSDVESVAKMRNCVQS